MAEAAHVYGENYFNGAAYVHYLTAS